MVIVPGMVIIFNPVAGRRRAALLWRVLDVLVHNGVRLDVAETRCSGDAACLAREAASRGENLVVAAGGDGTIAEVANGLLGTGVRLGVIPLGTANVLAHELALPFAPRAVAAALAFGRTRRLWPGLARGTDGARLFVQMLGVGFDAHVVHHLPLPLKRVFGRGAYVMESLRDTISYSYTPITVRLDGEETQAASVIVSVSLFRHNGAGAALMYGAALPLNLLAHAPGVQHVRARQVDVVGNRAAPVQTDGDPAGYAPLSVTDAPEPIDVVMG